MKDSQIQDLADRFCSILMAHASHGIATSSLEEMGEITLRDGLIVAAAAAGASQKQAWIFKREELPAGWSDSAVDLTIYRRGNNEESKTVGAVELKWWRQTDSANASNRRRDLTKDFIRAASNYKNVESFSFVALLSTEVSCSATTSTTAGDKDVMALVTGPGTQKWNLGQLADSPGIRSAVQALGFRLPIPTAFHTKLLATFDLHLASGRTASARIWSVIKPQRTTYLAEAELESKFGVKKRKKKETSSEDKDN